MPEGDVLFRTAATLGRWLGGREITEVTTRVGGIAVDRLVGRRIDRVEANGKHLLLRLDSGDVLHSHMRMSGSWHVYRTGERWQRPQRQARIAITCSDRVAVCFNAPVIELLDPSAEANHPSLAGLGPDVLSEPIDLGEMRRRVAPLAPSLALGELLLDQRVVAGIGNIWRCEALAVEGHHPWTPRSALTGEELDRLVATAGRLMHESMKAPGPAEGPAFRQSSGAPAAAGAAASKRAPGRATPRLVYRRTGRPCRRCGTLIASRRQGEQARTAYWCPNCQPLRPTPTDR